MTRKKDYWKDPEKHRAKSRAYGDAHREQRKARAKAWALANPGRANENHQKWRLNHLDKARRIARETHLRRKYGIAIADQDRLLAEQHQKCGICRIPLTEIHVDHDHKTGKLRGLLCRGCNLGIGFLKEDLEILEKAKLYLLQRKG